ncbi:MAG: hypothetical protein ACK40G_18150 [Cytophagaceae bacterium]
MTIKDIAVSLESSKHPVAKALHKSENFKVLVMGFKRGMILKEHKAHLPTKLTVLEGSVLYRENGTIKALSKHDETEIPVEVIHSVEAVEDSLCLLTQG